MTHQVSLTNAFIPNSRERDILMLQKTPNGPLELIHMIKAQRKSEIISDAIEFAWEAHSSQTRKGSSIPYINHPLRVALTLIQLGCSDEIVSAGILHDTVEDTSVTLKDIELKFGKYVAELVSGASEPDKSDTWEHRKEHTIEYLKVAPIEIVCITFADKLDFIRSIHVDQERIGEAVWDVLNRPKEQQRWLMQELYKAFSSRVKDGLDFKLVAEFKSEIDAVLKAQ